VSFARASYCERRWNIKKAPTTTSTITITAKVKKRLLFLGGEFLDPESDCVETSVIVGYSA
jgi:hypothetical protein